MFFARLLVLVLLAAPLGAVEIGASAADVVAAKGEPIGRLDAGKTVVLTYSDEVITLRDGKVATVKPVPAAATPRETTAVPSRPKADRAIAAANSVVIDQGALDWSTDYEAALARARAENKKLFLFFTGSDWCGWCMRLDREILSQGPFATYAAQDLVLVKLDFPRGLKQSAHVVKQNHRLARQYRIAGYPTVIVLDPAGKVVGKLGYQRGGPQPFIDALRAM